MSCPDCHQHDSEFLRVYQARLDWEKLQAGRERIIGALWGFVGGIGLALVIFSALAMAR